MSKRDERRRTFMKSPDAVQAQYWNGFITRTEAQQVFDQQAQVIQAQATAIQKLDTVITYVTEKLGVTIDDVNKWVKEKMEAAQKAAEATPTVTEGQTNNANNSQSEQQEPSSLIVAA